MILVARNTYSDRVELTGSSFWAFHFDVLKKDAGAFFDLVMIDLIFEFTIVQCTCAFVRGVAGRPYNHDGVGQHSEAGRKVKIVELRNDAAG